MTNVATGAAFGAITSFQLPGCPAPYVIVRQENPTPADVPAFHAPGFFFNDAAHLAQQSDSFCLLTAVNQRTGRADARCAFFVQGNWAISPAAAPFGSIEFAETLPDAVLGDLLQTLIRVAQMTGVSALRIVHYPRCYAPEQTDWLTHHLRELNFRIMRDDATQFLPITNESFGRNLHPSERRRLRKCRNTGFTFTHWTTPDVDEVVQFLVETRQRQGYQLTIAPDKLTRLLRQFPHDFPVFVVRDGDAVAALVVAVRVRSDILYAFQPASNPDHRAFSPMVLLVDGLYTCCRRHNVRLLDLGVSLDGNRQPKPGLLRFKRNLGALTSPKLTFEKTL